MITVNDLLLHAEELLAEDREVYFRDSIKNAYYAVYHSTIQLLNKHNIDILRQNTGEHRYLIERIKSVEHRLAKSIARDLTILRDRRIESCYRINMTINRLKAAEHIRYCQQVIKKIVELDQYLSQ